MRVKIEYTLEVNADQYRAEYGDRSASEIRNEIKTDSVDSVIAWLERVGVDVELVGKLK